MRLVESLAVQPLRLDSVEARVPKRLASTNNCYILLSSAKSLVLFFNGFQYFNEFSVFLLLSSDIFMIFHD